MYINPAQLARYAVEPWRIRSDDPATERAIMTKLIGTTPDGKYEEDIFYDGKIVHVFIVTFDIAFYLGLNRAKDKLEFTAYHKTTSKTPWVIWKEGKSAAMRSIQNMNFLFKKNPRDRIGKKRRSKGRSLQEASRI